MLFRSFLVISDDTDDSDSPFLFLMSPDGSLDSNLVQIEGLERIQDAESISQNTDEKKISWNLFAPGNNPEAKPDNRSIQKLLLIRCSPSYPFLILSPGPPTFRVLKES